MRRQTHARLSTLLLAASLATGDALAGSPFATAVIAFDPAPGQFVNHPAFSDPAAALGAPSGAGTATAGNTSVVSLGGFGGSIVLAFDQTVEDHPLNPLGLDAIVFGNAFWVNGPDRRWGEAGIIEISLDINSDGLANDPWYLIPGSHLPAPTPVTWQMWDSFTADPTYPPAFASWIPPGRSGVWESWGFSLPPVPFHSTPMTNPLAGAGEEAVYGYADTTPTLLLGDLDADNLVDDPLIDPAAFYTLPDDPFLLGVSPGSGGGDAFDIAWAIDAATGEAAGLPGFDFIRISTGVHHVVGVLGELSAEIDAVADVAPDPHGDHEGDGDIDLLDVAAMQRCFGAAAGQEGGCAPLEWEVDGDLTLEEVGRLIGRLTGPR